MDADILVLVTFGLNLTPVASTVRGDVPHAVMFNTVRRNERTNIVAYGRDKGRYNGIEEKTDELLCSVLLTVASLKVLWKAAWRK